MVKRCGSGCVIDVTSLTAGVETNELTGLGFLVAAKTCRCGMGPDQWESGLVVPSDGILGQPVDFIVTLGTVMAELSLVYVLMTAGATLSGKD